jgi:copper(I)-binding protein
MKSWLIALSCAFAMIWVNAGAAQVTVNAAWVRATVPGQTIAGAYLKITSATTAYLIGGSSAAAKAVELHQMSLENNVMKMRPLARLELPAGSTVELKPGSYHLMLLDIAHPLAAGERVPLKLTIEDKTGRRQTVDVNAAVIEPGTAGAQHGVR